MPPPADIGAGALDSGPVTLCVTFRSQHVHTQLSIIQSLVISLEY